MCSRAADWRDANVRREIRRAEHRDTAVIILRDPDRRILFARTSRLPGHWSLPGGGVTSSDASPAAAAARELSEEFGIHVDPMLLSPMGSAPSDLDVGTVYFLETTEPYAGAEIKDDREILESAWLEPSEALTRRLMPATRRILKTLRPPTG